MRPEAKLPQGMAARNIYRPIFYLKNGPATDTVLICWRVLEYNKEKWPLQWHLLSIPTCISRDIGSCSSHICYGKLTWSMQEWCHLPKLKRYLILANFWQNTWFWQFDFGKCPACKHVSYSRTGMILLLTRNCMYEDIHSIYITNHVGHFLG